VTPSLRRTIVTGLAFPLVLVGALAGGLGFVAGRAVYPRATPPEVAAVTTTAATPSPSPAPSPTAAPVSQGEPSGDGSGGGSSGSCPAGCECQRPPGGIVIVCHGGTAVQIP
jgi:hypothetical protein